MNLVIIFLASFIILYSMRFLICTLHRAHFVNQYGGDAAGHYVIIKQFKRNIRSRYIDQFLIRSEGPMSYAVLFHMIAALFPQRWLESGYKINLFLHALLSSCFLVYVFSFANNVLPVSAFCFTVLAALFLVVCPVSLYFYGANIAYISLGERLLAKMLTSFYYLFLLIFLSFGYWYASVITIVICALALLTSNFARQALLLPTIVLSIFLFNPICVFLFLMGLVLACILQSRRCLRSVKFQFLHLSVYYKSFMQSKTVTNALAQFSTWQQIRSLVCRPTLRQVVHVLLLGQPLRGLFFFPQLVIIIFCYFYRSDQALLLHHGMILLLAIYLIYLCTSVPKLSFIGESYRYLEYTTYFIFPFLLAYGLLHSGLSFEAITLIVAIYVAYNALFFLGYHRFLNQKQYEGSGSEDILSTMLATVSLKKALRILPIPLRFSLELCARASVQAIWWQPGSLTQAVQDEYLSEYPYPRKDFEVIVKKHAITHLVVEKASLCQLTWEYDFSHYEKIYEDQYFIVYKT